MVAVDFYTSNSSINNLSDCVCVNGCDCVCVCVCNYDSVAMAWCLKEFDLNVWDLWLRGLECLTYVLWLCLVAMVVRVLMYVA